jgi:two-component system NarL family response regulator
MTRLLLADDHALFRDALRLSLALVPGLEVVAEAHNGAAVVSLVGQYRPDVVCMDVNMPGLDGVQTTRWLRTVHPEVKVIGLSAQADLEHVQAMFVAGALGFVVKMNAGSELPMAIQAVMQGQFYLNPDLGLPEVAHMAGLNRLGAP